MIGSFVCSDVPEEAHKLNTSMYRTWASTTLADKKEIQYVKFDKSSIILDAFKLDEESGKSLIMRMHENVGSECKNKLEFCFDIKNPSKVNILEEPMDEWEVVGKEEDEGVKTIFKSDNRQVFHQLKPFQIFTMKLDPVFK